MSTLEFSLLITFGCVIAAVAGLLVAVMTHNDRDKHDD